MQKTLVTLLLVVMLGTAALADTLYLRNGSRIKGTFLGYENGKFIFQLDNGSRAEWAAAEVTRLVIDAANGALGNNPDDRGYPSRGGNTTGMPTGTAGWTTHPDLDVRLDDSWMRSGIMLRAGQRVRVDATGTIRLEGRTPTGPEGLRNRADSEAPEPNEVSGILLAGIGTDSNSPAILIGRAKEFTADRDGMLYFTVNHGVTRNASGSFRVRVQTDPNSGSSAPIGGGTGGGQTTGREKVITVQAGQAWTDTGIDVQPNMNFEFMVEGTITISSRASNVGPEGDMQSQVSTSRYPVQNAGVGAVLAKVRYRNNTDSQLLVVGQHSQASTEANEYGRLMLGINDDYFQDNRGSFTVRIRW